MSKQGWPEAAGPAIRKPRREENDMLELLLLDGLRLAFAFGVCGLVIWFWYWFMDAVGTF